MPARGGDDVAAETPPFSPVIALLTVAAIWDARLEHELRDLGLSTRKYALLAHVEATPGISFSELARRSQITVQSVHTAARSLAEAGFVVDANAHAGAASDLRVTPEGIRLLRAADARLAALDATFGGGAPTLTSALEGLHERPFEGSAASE
ncbi:MarR family winged helix-turn-helix transcriptional regulator [Microbacterium lemovicicum]|uniref:MarR family winged helix-turn-helix transcriptional regulator n=1 Tax=Microbacterium lemovicicum TaxID=1072463 RepID=UPI001F49C2DE|nr:helix-turn-helix domain-containing protein [Microbacterium lemovicicum]